MGKKRYKYQVDAEGVFLFPHLRGRAPCAARQPIPDRRPDHPIIPTAMPCLKEAGLALNTVQRSENGVQCSDCSDPCSDLNTVSTRFEHSLNTV